VRNVVSSLSVVLKWALRRRSTLYIRIAYTIQTRVKTYSIEGGYRSYTYCWRNFIACRQTRLSVLKRLNRSLATSENIIYVYIKTLPILANTHLYIIIIIIYHHVLYCLIDRIRLIRDGERRMVYACRLLIKSRVGSHAEYVRDIIYCRQSGNLHESKTNAHIIVKIILIPWSCCRFHGW